MDAMKTDDTCPGCRHDGMTFTPDEDQTTTRKGYLMGTLTCPSCGWWDDMALMQVGIAEDGSDPDCAGPDGKIIETEHNENAIPGDPCPSGLSNLMTAWIAADNGWLDDLLFKGNLDPSQLMPEDEDLEPMRMGYVNENGEPDPCGSCSALGCKGVACGMPE